MAASANPSGNQESSNQNNKNSSSFPSGNGVAANSANSGGTTEHAASQPALKHNPGISADWTAEEQSILDDLLVKYASDTGVIRYAKIAMQLKDKTVRDVALRCRWMSKKENGKRRKEDQSSARKNKDKKERVSDSSTKSLPHPSTRPSGPSYAVPMIPVDNDDGITYKDIGGVTGELLEQNAQMFNQISANFASFQIHDNVNLLSKARDNILAIMNDIKDVPDVMKQMPPLPVKVNDELANSILPRTSHQMKS